MRVYRRTRGIFRNAAIRREIESLDPERDHCRIVQLLGAYEFPFDITRSLEFALFRTYISPSISDLLHRTGQFLNAGQKRYDDTSLLIGEFLENGYDSPRGRQAIERMNAIHGRFQISNDDYLFVLSTFIFEPIDWLDRFGWRRLTRIERQAIYVFWREVGRRMHLRDIPDSLAAFRAWVEEYKNRNVRYAQSNREVAEATMNITKGWLPSFARPLVAPVVNALLDPQMRAAFGFGRPVPGLAFLLNGILKLRALLIAPFAFERYPSRLAHTRWRSYPDGYEIDQLGPLSEKKR